MPDTPGTGNFPTSLDSLTTLFQVTDNAQTSLTALISSVATTIPVTSTSLFPSSGSLAIENEIIYYTGKTSTSFTGCVRGASGTSSASHADTTEVNGRIIAAHHSILASVLISIQQKLGISSSTPVSGTFLKGTGTGISAWAALTSLEITTALGYTPVPPSRAINGHALSGDVTVAFSELGSLPTTLSGFGITDGALATDLSVLSSSLTSHTSNTSNPHSVTKSQVGLGNVANSLQLVAASNLSDLSNAATARTNLGLAIGANVQPFNSNLSTYAAIAPSANVQTLLGSADYSAFRSSLGLGTLATQNGTFSGTSSGTNTGDQTSVTGNAGTATALQTPRNINGVAFDGSASITVPAAAGTLSGSTLASGVTASSLTSFGASPSLTTPLLGTPTSGTLTNCTGLPIASGIGGLGAGIATFLGTPSSANLAAAITDETGSGALVFASSPTLVTPALGTPSALVLTNATGLPPVSGIVGWPVNASGILTNDGSGALSWAAGGGASGANPSASVGLSAVNGSASTFLRSDGAPAIDQSIAPTWTGQHIWSLSNAAAIAIGPSGNTNPSLRVKTSTANGVTGIEIQNGADGGGVTIQGLGIGSAEDIKIFTANGGNIVSNRSIITSVGGQAFIAGSSNSDYNIGIDGGSNGRLRMRLESVIAWSNDTNANSTIDTQLARNAAGVVEINNGTAGTLRDLTLRDLFTNNASFLIRTKTTITGGGTSQIPTLTSGPVAGNPTKWLPIDDNGTTRYCPVW